MNDLITDYNRYLMIKGFSFNTRKNYLYKIKLFLQYCKDNSKKYNMANVKDYLFDLVDNKKLSLASLKQNIGAIKFFFQLHSVYHMN